MARGPMGWLGGLPVDKQALWGDQHRAGSTHEEKGQEVIEVRGSQVRGPEGNTVERRFLLLFVWLLLLALIAGGIGGAHLCCADPAWRPGST